MIRASFIAYMVGTAFLGLSYWDILYHLVFISVLIKKFALEDIERYQRNPEAFGKEITTKTSRNRIKSPLVAARMVADAARK